MNNKLSSPPDFIVVRVIWSLIFSLVFCRLLFVFFVLFLFVIALSVLQIKITTSDYPFGILNSTQARCIWYNIIWQSCQWLVTRRWFSPGTSGFSTNKTERYDITAISLNECWIPQPYLSLHCLLFFELRLLITPLVTPNFYYY